MNEDSTLDGRRNRTLSEYEVVDFGWMAGKDAADDEFESTGTIRISGDTKWCAIKRQLKGLWTIVQTGGEQR